jgi:cyclopropane-fatty-acyl-phospholipid synthase
MKFAAEKYGVSAYGVTVSKEQLSYAKENTEGLPIHIALQDYRELNDKFDYIISIGMFEHVGYKNYKKYMQIAERCLKDNGLFLLHTVGFNKSVTKNNPWTEKYIFPGGMLPSITQVGKAIEGIFVMEDWHNFGPDYDKTLMAWFKNFSSNWDLIKNKYDARFARMWKYYLLSYAGAFRARDLQLWQIVLSKDGLNTTYSSVR